jgi:hypothetical protein
MSDNADRPRDCDEEEWQPQPGFGAGGERRSPADPAPERESEPAGPVPAPGVPVSDAEYRRLKEEARRRRIPKEAPDQEDPGGRDPA